MKSLSPLAGLSGRRASVTGGAGHIGRAAAEALLEMGAEVILLDLAGPGLDEAVDTLAADARGRVRALPADLSDSATPGSIASELKKSGEAPDILVNNAAFVGTSGLEGWVTRFEDQSVDTWNAAMQVNLTAAFALIQALTPALRRSGSGARSDP